MLNPRLSGGFGKHALENALRAIGAPWMSVANIRPLAPTPDEAAQRIATALVGIRGRRIHLCPLDGADDLPNWTFGNNRIAKMSASELDTIISPARLLRHHEHWVFDSRAFAQMQWLVVKEEVQLDPDPAVRAVPLLGANIGDVDGRIGPHTTRLPAAVEDALFALLLRPWEDAVKDAEFDWRPFRIPWVYTIDDDILASPAAPPDPTSLQWTEVALNGVGGEVVSVECPEVWPVCRAALDQWSPLDDGFWQRIQAARSSPLMGHPVAHFLVRAFLADGIDEFLAHITAIEAALALPRDHHRAPGKSKRQAFQKANPGQPVPWRPKLADDCDPGTTARLNLRIAALLGSGVRKNEFLALYKSRSDFIHGATMPDIPVSQRLAARRLARNVAAELVNQACISACVDRVEFLSSLCP